MPTDYGTWLPWLYLAVNGIIGLVVVVFGALITQRIAQGNSKLDIIHATVNSNLAAKQQEVASEQATSADLRVQLASANTMNAALLATLVAKGVISTVMEAPPKEST